MDEMSESKFNESGKYRTAAGTDDLRRIEGVSLSLPQGTDGLADYQEGDEVDVMVKGRVGAPDEEGNIAIDVINLDLKHMPGEAKMYRRDQKNSMPPPSTMGAEEE